MLRISPANKCGFVLLDSLLAVACLLVLCALLSLSAHGVQKYYYKNQVRMATELLAADIRQLQQETMFSPMKQTKTLYVAVGDTQAYTIYMNENLSVVAKKVAFAEQGLGDVYFSDYKLKINFARNGSPKANGTYLLRHKKLANFYCKLALQPVTGRVTVTEYGS